MNGAVHALAISGGELYAGGEFRGDGKISAHYVVKWDGSTWSALRSGTNSTDYIGVNNYVYALALSGSDLYVAGEFTSTGERFPTPDKLVNYIAKWNGSSWTALASGLGGLFGPNPYVYALAVSGSDLYVGGGFTTAGGKASAYVARAVLGDAPGYNQLTGTPLSSGGMQLSYIGDPATNYALDRAFNLTAPISWVGQETNTMTIRGVLTFTNTPAPGTNNFWRVRSLPY